MIPLSFKSKYAVQGSWVTFLLLPVLDPHLLDWLPQEILFPFGRTSGEFFFFKDRKTSNVHGCELFIKPLTSAQSEFPGTATLQSRMTRPRDIKGKSYQMGFTTFSLFLREVV